MIRFLVIGLLALLVGRALRSFLRGLKEGVASKPPAQKPGKGQVMARDPVCGTFVVPSSALTARGNSGTVYFCSDRCRQAFLARP